MSNMTSVLLMKMSPNDSNFGAWGFLGGEWGFFLFFVFFMVMAPAPLWWSY